MTSIRHSPRNIAMDYLSRREHSRVELEKKLSSKGFDDEQIEQTLNKLQKENLQSDSRFVQNYLNYRVSKGFGPIKIYHELKQKGVTAELIQQAEDEAEINWFLLLEALSERKYGGRETKDLKEKQKRSRFLQQRGFLIHDIMRLFTT